MIIRNISELEALMTDEQKAESKANYDKFFGIPYGDREPIMCGPHDDGVDYLVKVDLENWNEDKEE